MKTGAWPRLVEGLLLRPPAEESVWLVEQSAAVAMKPGARRPCLMKIKTENTRSWDRQVARSLRKILSMGLVVWTEMLRL